MEEYVNKLVDNTFKNYEFEQAKKIIADKISWYEMKLLNSVDKDKIREIKNKLKNKVKEIGANELSEIYNDDDWQDTKYYNAQIDILERLEEE